MNRLHGHETTDLTADEATDFEDIAAWIMIETGYQPDFTAKASRELINTATTERN